MSKSEDNKRTGLLIAAHGETRGEGDNWLAHEVAARLHARGTFAGVEAGLLRGTPAIEDSAARVAGERLVVFPLFMSAGYFVETTLPGRLGLTGGSGQAPTRQVAMLDPLPAIDGLAAFIGASARRTVNGAGVDAQSATLLLVAHGSTKGSASADAARDMARAIAASCGFRHVALAFLEEPPFVADQLRDLPGPLVVAGLFIGEGLHGGEDLSAALEACGRADAYAIPPLARDSAFADLICDHIQQASR